MGDSFTIQGMKKHPVIVKYPSQSKNGGRENFNYWNKWKWTQNERKILLKKHWASAAQNAPHQNPPSS